MQAGSRLGGPVDTGSSRRISIGDTVEKIRKGEEASGNSHSAKGPIGSHGGTNGGTHNGTNSETISETISACLVRAAPCLVACDLFLHSDNEVSGTPGNEESILNDDSAGSCPP